MAGGPNAAVMLCLSCLGKANRTAEGAENDQYLCELCGRGFSVDWRKGPPKEPTWPPSVQDQALIERLREQRAAQSAKDRDT
jgi:hypothetical protein